jgi:hypothetical protein
MSTTLSPTVEGIFSIPRNVGSGYVYSSVKYPMVFNQDYSMVYGISMSGTGNYNYGTIYSIRVSDGTLNVLQHLNFNTGYNTGNIGQSYTMIFSQDYTTLYGSMSDYGQDPSNNALSPTGVIFSFNLITNQYTILKQLNSSSNVGRIVSSLVLNNNETVLYGINDNNVFQYKLQTGVYSPIFDGFINSYAYDRNINDGWNTRGKVNQANANGNNQIDSKQLTLNGQYLVGYCYYDYNAPTANQSFLYKIDLSNTDISNNGSVLYTFDGSNNTIYGVKAISAPVIGADGKMYGFTKTGGLNNYGTFYSIDLSGNISVVYNFNSTSQGVKQINGGYRAAIVYISNDKRTFYSTDNNTSSIFSVDISGNFTLFTTPGYGNLGNQTMTIDNQKPPNFYFLDGENNTFRKYQNSTSTVLSIKTYSTMSIPYGSIKSTIYNNYDDNYLYVSGGFPSAQVCVATDNRNIYAITNNSLVSFDNHGNHFTKLFSFVLDPINSPTTSENPCCLIYNSANNKLYGVNYGASNGNSIYYGNGSFFSYNLSTNVYTSINSFSQRCINIILNHKKTIIYGLNSIYNSTSRFWSYDISNNIISTIHNQGIYFENSNITITKNDSTIYCTYYDTSIGSSILITIDTATSTYTDNVYTFSSNLNVGTMTLSHDETLLYGIINNTIFSYRIATQTITNLYNFVTGTAMSPLVLGGSKNNNHILYGTLTNSSASGLPSIYSYDTLFNTFSTIYNYGGTNLISTNYVYPEKGGSPLGTILYANKDTIITTTRGGGTYELGAIVKVRIHYPEAPCFLEGTRILCLDETSNQMVYIPVQNIRKCMKIKTAKHGFVPVNMIGVSEIENEGSERIMNRLYRLKQAQYADLFEDLVITGCHSTLVDGLTNKQIQDTLQIFDMVFMTDDKYRLLACLDEKAQPYEKSGNFTIYHIALDHDDYFMNYGIYANGLLVESCSQRYLKELSGMRLIE